MPKYKAQNITEGEHPTLGFIVDDKEFWYKTDDAIVMLVNAVAALQERVENLEKENRQLSQDVGQKADFNPPLSHNMLGFDR